MAEGNNFFLALIAYLHKQKSIKQIKEDAKNLGDIKVPLIGTLSKSKTKAQLKQDSASLNGTVNLTGKVNKKGIVTAVQQATQQAQTVANKKSIQVSINLKRDKLVNDIKVFGQQNTKLFKDADMAKKYNSLLDNAKLASSGKEIKALRLQLSAMRSEIKATNLSGLTLGDTLKKTFKRATELFTSTGGVMLLVRQMRQAWTEAINLDTAYTDLIKVQNELSRSDYPEYLERCNKKAQDLAATQKSLIEGATEFSKSGYTLSQSDALTEKSTILANVGEMSASDSAKAIISGVQAYDVVDGYTDVIDKADALISKYNEIGNTASITTAEIAQGVQKVGSVFADSNTSVDQFIALLSAGNRQFQDADTLALGLRTAALRIRGCKVELSQMNEETEGVYTTASKLAEKIEGLTNIDGNGGVKILEADGETFRSIYDIFLDISKVYQQMSDTDQSALLELIAGKTRASAVSATLNNMTEAQEIYERSLHSAGSAQREYDKYLGSSEASLNRFKSSMTETYQSVIDGKAVTGLLNCGNATLQFVNSLGLVESSLKGIIAIGVVKSVTTLSAAFKASAIQASKFGTALNTVKNMSKMAKGTAEYKNALDALKLASIGLSDAQLKQVLASKALSDSDRIAILRTTGLTKAQAQAKLAQMNLTQSTKSQAAANASATASTFSLTAAVKGFSTSLKLAFMNNPVGISIMALSMIIGAVSSKVSEYNEKLREARQANIDTATTASENADKLKDLYSEYTRLASIQDRTTSEEESFKTAIENIIVALGDKAEILKDLTVGTDEYAAALARATKEELQSQAVTATIGRKSAEEDLQDKIWSDWSGSQVTIDSNDKGKALSDEAQKAVDIVSESLKEFETINRTWGSISWDIDSDNPVEALEYYNSLIDAREKLVLASKDDESLLDTEIYEDLNTAINSMSESLDTYIEKLYEEQKLNYMAKNGIPNATEEYKAMEFALVSVAGSSVDLQDRFKELLTSDFSDLAANIESVGDAAESVSDELKQADNVAESFTDAWDSLKVSADDATKDLSNTLLDLAEKGRLTKETFNEADSTEYFKNLGISADIAVLKINKLVDESKQLSSMSDQISKMSEALGTKKENGFVDADTLSNFDVEVRGLESWDRFQSVLGSTTSTYQECQDAANALATEWANSSDFLAQLTEDTKEYYETQLQDMGVENYDEIVESTLALKEAKEALAEIDLSSATEEEIQNLITEEGYVGLVAEQMWALYYAKLAESDTFLDSSSDCAQLQALANDAMLTAEAMKLLYRLIEIYNGIESGAYDTNIELRRGAERDAKEIAERIRALAQGEGEGLIVNPKIELGNKGKKSGGGSGSSKDKWKEAYDAELKELEHMHELGLISDEEYWKARMDLNEKYFGESSGKHQKYLDEYRDNEEDILEGLKKLWEDYYNERKNNLKDLISYAEKLYDREIDSLEANIKQIEEKRDAEKKYWQDRIDAIGDEINAMEDANDERERAINLQNKQYQLQKAMHQRTILLYSESKGMHYVNDTKAERDAKNDLDSAKHDIKVADLKKQQDELQKQLDIILESYDAQIESINKQIDSLKEVKSAWSDIVDNQEFKELEERLKSLFGDDIKSKILSGNTDFINDIIAQYSSTSDMLRTIEDATLADIQNMVAQYGILPENLVPISNAAADIANTLGTVDTSGFNANMDSTAQSSASAAEKVQSVTTALNNLSNDVANYQMPALNTDNFTSAFAEDGGILTALNSFMERYKEICDGIPNIWNNSLAEAFGQGGGNGDPLAGGLANDTKYDVLFTPMIEALDNCKATMEAKLKECLETFTTFQTDLSGVIGVGGGSEESGSSQSGTGSGKGKGSGGEKKSESGSGSDTIVGAIVEGGGLIDQALNGDEDSWSASFNTAKDSIHETAASIVDCIESMVETIVNACIKAIEAINMLASADDNNPNNPTPSPYGKVGHAHSSGNAHAEGTAKFTGDWEVQSNENYALVGEIGRELIVRNGKYFTVGDNGAEMFKIQKGDIVFNHEQTESLLRDGHISGHGKAYADGTVGGGKVITADGTILYPLQPGDRAWEVQKAFEPFINKIISGEMELVNTAMFEHQKQMEDMARQINYVSSITNNNRNVQQPIYNDIHVTLPNVTNATSAESLLRDLESIGRKKYQVNW